MNTTEVAIVGMGCRFPGGVRSPEEYWDFLVQARDGMVEMPADRWNTERYYDADPEAPGRMYTRHGGFLTESLWDFDPEYFGISPREAQIMDPQQRLLLEVTAEALDDAGLAGRVAGRSVGVYVGGFMGDNQVTRHTAASRMLINAHTSTAGTFTMLSNRLSYVFDLRGPSMTIDTACSSSLVAFHQAREAVVRGECEVALVGGVNAMISPETFVSMCKGRFLAPDGRCKTFDASADGYARGEGAGVLVLKPLADARRDGDRVYAVIRGTGVNQDGHTSGITVPNPEAQATLMRQVLTSAGVDPALVGYIEAHGTGTAVGDPLEMRAIGAALGAVEGRDQALRIGSVKAAIGHTEAAAGVAGVIKAVLSLYHGRVTPQAWLNELNPRIPFDDYRLHVVTEVQEFPAVKGRSLAAVNGFGYGGTNAHALLESAPEGLVRTPRRPAHRVFPLSGRTEAAIRTLAAGWSAAAEGMDAARLDALADAAWTRRAHHPQRIGIPFADTADLRAQLDTLAEGAGRAPGRAISLTGGPPTIVFSGMGPQWWGMARDLLGAAGAFARAAAEVDTAFQRLSGFSIVAELRRDEADSRVTRTEIAQPANFLVQVGLMAELAELGVQPLRVVGHSVGEVSAAYLSGMLDLDDALLVSYHRSRLQAAQAHTGAMLAVGLAEADALLRVAAAAAADPRVRPAAVDVAAVNSPTAVTLAGDEESIVALAEFLGQEGVFARRLAVEVPYHSHLMDPILDRLTAALTQLHPRPPRLELWSTVTGKQVGDELWDGDYWARNVRRPVRFADAIAGLIAAGETAFLEVGPHPVLAGNIREVLVRSGVTGTALPTLVRNQNDALSLTTMVADLYAAGCLDAELAAGWAPGADPGVSDHQSLPCHPWERTRLWEQSPEVVRDRMGTEAALPLLGDRTSASADEWDVPLSLARLPWLRDHVVDGLVLLPGAAFIDAALSAAITTAAAGGAKPITAALESLRFVTPLVIDPHDVPILRIGVEAATGRFTVRSRSAVAQEWTIHATGRILNAGLEAVCGPEPVPSTSARTVSGPDFYARLDARGLSYGPAFQRVVLAQVEAGLVIAEVDATVAIDTNHPAHPAVTDAALQCVAALLDATLTGIPAAAGAPRGALVPAAVRAVRLLAPLPDKVRVSVVSRPGDDLCADVVLRGLDGAAVLELLGVRFLPVAPAQPVLTELAPLWYEPVFEPRNDRDAAAAGAQAALERLILVPLSAEAIGRATALANLRSGAVVIDAIARLSEPITAESAQNAVSVSLAEAVLTVRAGEHAQVAVLAPAPALEPGALLPVAGAAPVMAAVNALAGIGRCLVSLADEARAAQISVSGTVITQDAFGVPGDPEGPQLVPGSMVGARRVMLNEQPAVHWRLVDATDADLPQLEQELVVGGVFADEDADEVALRDGMRLVPRLRHTLEEHLALRSVATPVLDPEESFEIEVPGTGILSELGLRRVARRAPGPGEVEVRMESLGLNYKDGLKAIGLLTGTELDGTYFGTSLGMEGLGIVTRVGPEVTDTSAGDRLLVAARGMARRFATVRLDDSFAVPAPTSWTRPEHFASTVSFLTAHYGLAHAAALSAGETVLIHGGAGGTGRAAIQVARRLGAIVIAAAGTPRRRAEAEAAGAHHTVRSRSIGFVDEVLALTGGRGVDVVFNSAPGEVAQQNLTVAAEFGRIVEIGKQGIYTSAVLDLSPFDKNLSFIAIDLDRILRYKRALGLRLVAEVTELFDAGAYTPLPCEVFGLDQLPAAFDTIVRGGSSARVCLDLSTPTPEALPALPSAGIHSDATYLVTGGFGAFGLAVARWLAASGARTLVLLGRRGPDSDDARATLARLTEAGVTVVVERADVTSPEAMHAVMSRACGLPPLRGVFHTAGVIQDESFAELTPEAVEAVIGTKVDGLAALQAALAGIGVQLDHLVLFSSVTTLAGTARQLSYAAANAALDTAAARSRAAGWPTVSVNWGALSGGGMAQSTDEIARYLALMGLGLFDLDRACEYLGEVLALGVTQVLVGDLDWAQWASMHPASAASPRFAEHIAAAGAGGEAGNALREQLLAVPEDQRAEVISLILTDQVATVLGIPAESIDPATPLPDLGMDSLMAVELGARVNVALGLDVSALEFSRGGGLTGLAGRLTVQLTGVAA